MNGGVDEKHCWQLEMNDCQNNEYKCYNGIYMLQTIALTGMNSFVSVRSQQQILYTIMFQFPLNDSGHTFLKHVCMK